jgi:hypothetical protein
MTLEKNIDKILKTWMFAGIAATLWSYTPNNNASIVREDLKREDYGIMKSDETEIFVPECREPRESFEIASSEISSEEYRRSIVATCKDYDKHLPLSVNYSNSVSAEEIDKILEKFDSPAKGKGKYFVSYGQKYGVDPLVALAFFANESTLGKFGVANKTKGIGNREYRSNEHKRYYQDENGRKWAKYDSWEQSIDDWYNYIQEKYLESGKDTIEEIVPVYAPATENDVNQYVSDIRSFVRKYREPLTE